MTTSVNPSGKHPLDGARERLKRADENIRNLNAEVSQFLSGFPTVSARRGRDNNTVITDDNQKAFEVIRQHALAGTTIPRFGVLAGEIVHHFRSAFDHIIWQLATPDDQRRFATEIEFPVCELMPKCVRKPDGKVKHSAYCRKVQGVASITALTRIERLQPYHRVDRFNSPLLQIHLLDKFDKHRELVSIPVNLFERMIYTGRQAFYTAKDSASGGFKVIGPIGRHINVDVEAQLSLNVAFAELRKWETEPLIVFLEKLFRFTSDTVESFAAEF